MKKEIPFPAFNGNDIDIDLKSMKILDQIWLALHVLGNSVHKIFVACFPWTSNVHNT